MSLFADDDHRSAEQSAAKFDATNETPDMDCRTCGERMLMKDIDAEKVEQDGMCVSCRDHVRQRIEESAVASFLDGGPSAIQDIFEKIILQLDGQMTYADRIPADLNEVCRKIRFINGRVLLTLERFKTGDINNIRIECRNDHYPSVPDWCIDFSIATPISIILAAIKAAITK